MKTKELIKLLTEEDPSGEEEVCIDGIDIFTVEKLPAWYDGRFQVLERDPSKAPYYDIVGGKYRGTGWKIKITTLDFVGAIWNDPNFKIDYSECSSYKLEELKQSYENERAECLKLHKEMKDEKCGLSPPS